MVVLAFITWFPIMRNGLDLYGILVAVLLMLMFFCFNHFVNRRRALRSLSPPAD